MAYPPPARALALFSLEPINERACSVLAHPENRDYVSTFAGVDGQKTQGLDIGFIIGSKSRYTLATLGRSATDVTIEGHNISAIHCSFEIHQESGEIMLHDLSRLRSTQTFGDDAIPFQAARSPRQIVVADKLNTHIGIGGLQCNLIQFRLVWHRRSFDVAEQVRHRSEISRLARTIEPDLLSGQSFQSLAEAQTPDGQGLLLRYVKRSRLGQGTFSEVWKAVNVDSGSYLAVKMVIQPPEGFQDGLLNLLKREVKVLSKASHVSQTIPTRYLMLAKN